MLNTISRTTALAVVLALGAVATPALAVALAVGPPAGTPSSTNNPGTAHQPAGTPNATTNPGTTRRPSTPGPTASAKAKGRAYGKYCADQSKKHVDGEKGTPFSRCVTAMAKLASEQTRSPRNACKTESKKHVDGEKGTPFSRCVSAGAKLLKDQAAAQPSAS